MCYQYFISYACSHIKEDGTQQCAIWGNTENMCIKPQPKTQEVGTPCYVCYIKTEATRITRQELDAKTRQHVTDILNSYLFKGGDELSPFQKEVKSGAKKDLLKYVDLYSFKLQVAEEELRGIQRGRAASLPQPVKVDTAVQDRAASHECVVKTAAMEFPGKANVQQKVEKIETAVEGTAASGQQAIKADTPLESKADWDEQAAKSDTASTGTQSSQLQRVKVAQVQIESINRFWGERVIMHEEQLKQAARTHNIWLVDRIGEKLDKAHQAWHKRTVEAFEEMSAEGPIQVISEAERAKEVIKELDAVKAIKSGKGKEPQGEIGRAAPLTRNFPFDFTFDGI